MPEPEQSQNWLCRQWKDVRGNAKWDAAKTLFGIVIAAFIGILKFLRSGPDWQVWTIVALGVAAFLWFAFFDSRFGKIAAALFAASAFICCIIFSWEFNHKAEQTTTLENVTAETHGAGSPAYAAGRDMYVYITNATTTVKSAGTALAEMLDSRADDWEKGILANVKNNGFSPLRYNIDFWQSFIQEFNEDIRNAKRDLRRSGQRSDTLNSLVPELAPIHGQNPGREKPEDIHIIAREIRKMAERIGG